MKPDYVKRDVRSVSARNAGDAPAIGRVAKMASRGGLLDQRGSRRRTPSQSAQRKRRWRRKVLILRSAAIVIFTLITLVTVLWIWGSSKLGQTSQNQVAQSEVLAPSEPRVPVAFLSRQDAIDLTRHAIDAKTPEQVQQYFHFPPGEEQQVLDFLKRRSEIDGKLNGYEWLDTIEANGARYEAVLARSFNLKDETRLALIYTDDQGQWKIDYPAFARIQTPDWESIMTHQVPEGIVRVMIAQDTYYNRIYADDSKWRCYGFASPDDERLLLGYCRVGSAQHLALQEMVPSPDHPARAVLKIRHDPAAQDRQFEIVEVIAQDWVITDIPFDQRFTVD